MRGRDAVRLMREMGYTGIVLGVTGNALKEDLEDFADNGADRVVMKPLSIKLFNDIMTELKSL
jgi:CheY-like chemotaxis protein